MCRREFKYFLSCAFAVALAAFIATPASAVPIVVSFSGPAVINEGDMATFTLDLDVAEPLLPGEHIHGGTVVFDSGDGQVSGNQFVPHAALPNTSSSLSFPFTYANAGIFFPSVSGEVISFDGSHSPASMSSLDLERRIEIEVVRVPAPGTLLLLGSGLAGLAALRRKFSA